MLGNNDDDDDDDDDDGDDGYQWLSMVITGYQWLLYNGYTMVI